MQMMNVALSESYRMTLTLSAMLVFMPNTFAESFESQRETVLALGQQTEAPVMTDAAGFAVQGNLRAIYFDALPWKGSPTKVFAWLGLPDTRKGPVPGVVLVHGGGGTAHTEWVTRWTDRGFAAISIAVEGQTDKRDVALQGDSNPAGWASHEWAGPKRQGIYHDSAEPLQDQWMYHAVADTILANSLLRSLPEVQADKVGLMGISWGGVITSTAVGIDDRFAFAIPVYGCGNLAHAENMYGKALGENELYEHVWDPMLRLGGAKMPILWLSWPKEMHFPLDCLAASSDAAGGPQMISIVPGMGHGGGPGWSRPESYAFGESIVQTGIPWCREGRGYVVPTETETSGTEVRVSFASEKPLEKAVLVSTVDGGVSTDRHWVESSANLSVEGEVWQVTAQLPLETTAWFVNVHSGALTVSSRYREIDQGPSRGERVERSGF